MRHGVRSGARPRRREAGLLAAAVSLSVLAACSGGSGGSGGSGPAPTVTASSGTATTTTASPAVTASPSASGASGPGDWTTYNRDLGRTGFVPGAPAPHRLAPAWTAGLDGAVYGQPLVLGDEVVASTEHDSVYGIGLADGKVRWHVSLGTPMPLSGLPCGNIDPLGITSTAAFDPATGSLFVLAEVTGGVHRLVALDPDTGKTRFTRVLDISGRNRLAEQQRGALAVANGRVYVPFGGLAGDCGNYVGYVAAVDADGGGATAVYRVPTAREGGIWAPSGPAVDSAGDVWVAVGSGASFDKPYDGSDSVLRLTPDLSRRLDYFAPSSWGDENADDKDLGSTGPLLVGGDRVLVSGKDGNVYLLDAGRLGGIGGELDSVGDCRGFGGLAYDAGAGAAFVPCADGLLRVDVGSGGLKAGWRAPTSVAGSPVLGGGAVWTLDAAAGVLHVLAEASGREITTAKVGTTSRFAAPVLSGTHVLVPTMSGVTALTIS